MSSINVHAMGTLGQFALQNRENVIHIDDVPVGMSIDIQSAHLVFDHTMNYRPGLMISGPVEHYSIAHLSDESKALFENQDQLGAPEGDYQKLVYPLSDQEIKNLVDKGYFTGDFNNEASALIGEKFTLPVTMDFVRENTEEGPVFYSMGHSRLTQMKTTTSLGMDAYFLDVSKEAVEHEAVVDIEQGVDTQKTMSTEEKMIVLDEDIMDRNRLEEIALARRNSERLKAEDLRSLDQEKAIEKVDEEREVLDEEVNGSELDQVMEEINAARKRIHVQSAREIIDSQYDMGITPQFQSPLGEALAAEDKTPEEQQGLDQEPSL